MRSVGYYRFPRRHRLLSRRNYHRPCSSALSASSAFFNMTGIYCVVVLPPMFITLYYCVYFGE